MRIPAHNQRSSSPYLVLQVIFGISVLAELVLSLADLGIIGDPQLRGVVFQYGAFWSGLLKDWQSLYFAQPILMFLTHGFLHGGIVHFSINMIALFPLGKAVVSRVGWRWFLLVYIGSMVGGGLGYAVLSQEFQPMIGASGAIYGLAGALVYWQVAGRLRANLPLWPIVKTLLFIALLNVAVWWAIGGQLAWQAHLAGGVFGAVLAWLNDSLRRSIVRK